MRPEAFENLILTLSEAIPVGFSIKMEESGIAFYYNEEVIIINYSENASNEEFARYLLDEMQSFIAHKTSEYWPRINSSKLDFYFEGDEEFLKLRFCFLN